MKNLVIYISLLLFIFLSLFACGSSGGGHSESPDPPPPEEVQKLLTILISLHSDGTQGDDNSSAPVISSDGAFIAFESTATNLIDNDLNGLRDIFVHEIATGSTTRVSIGSEADNSSFAPSINSDGTYVAFESTATNLVANDLNGLSDIFVHDRNTGVTERVSVHTDGTEADDPSSASSISADGRFVAFESTATNLIDNDSNGLRDIFVHDRDTGTTERVSVHTDSTEADNPSSAPSISADGRLVAFESTATNLIDNDLNGLRDIFVHDRDTGTTERVSVKSDGTEANDVSFAPSISADGRFVAFESSATNLIDNDSNGLRDIFVHNRNTGVTERVSVDSIGTQADDFSLAPSISADGGFVAFESMATNLIDNDLNGLRDIFVHDRNTAVTERVSVDTNGIETDDFSLAPSISISADGGFVAFESSATNLVDNDLNGLRDIFLRDLNP
jgi:Tol biopolymer transport system component